MTPDTMTKDQKSVLLYAETCAVDKGSLLEGVRMNEADHEALRVLQEMGFLKYGRIPYRLIEERPSWFQSNPTHWVKITDAGWALASACRKARSSHLGPYSDAVFAELNSMEEVGV